MTRAGRARTLAAVAGLAVAALALAACGASDNGGAVQLPPSSTTGSAPATTASAPSSTAATMPGGG